MSFYIYAETAFHHEGDKNYLKKLVNEAKCAGVQGVKFQVLTDLSQLMSIFHSSYEDAKNWVLTVSEWKEVFAYTKELGLDIILMPIDVGAFELIKHFDIKHIEIHSVSFKDKKLFSKLDESVIPLIFGVGGRTLDEIDYVLNKYKDRDTTLMVGFQSYPSELQDINLSRIKELKNKYPSSVIGYADHSSFDDEMAIISNDYAYILGARIFEKHITVDEGIERIDFQSAVGAKKISTIISRLAFLDKSLNIDEADLFEMNAKEINYRNRQKIPVAKHNLEIGHMLTEDDIELKMIDTDNAIDDIELLINHKLKNKVMIDRAFLARDLQ